MPISILFLTAGALADSRRFEQVPGDAVAALQVAQGTGDSAQRRVSCGDFSLADKKQTPIQLRPRQSSAKVIDTFAFGSASAYEMEELLLRMYEMGKEVSEFHIVEGDRDFFGRQKPYEFEGILNSGQARCLERQDHIPQGRDPNGREGLQYTRSTEAGYAITDTRALRPERHPFGRGFGRDREPQDFANSEELRARFRFMKCPHPHAQLCV